MDTADLVTKLNQAATAISYLKQNCLQTMEAVYTNGKSAFSISFGEWKNYINIVESTLMNQIGPVYCIQKCSVKYSQEQLQQIMSYSGLNLKDEELKISQIVKYFHDSPSILDYLSILEGNAQSDKDAQDTMSAIEQDFKSIVVDRIIQSDYSIYPIVKGVF